MNRAQATVFVVDADLAVRGSLFRLLHAAAYRVRLFESAERFLEANDPEIPGCLMLDVSMPGMCGLELQRLLKSSPSPRPIVFLSATTEIGVCVQAMKQGAVDFLTKPMDDVGRLFKAVDQALQRDAEERRQRTFRHIIGQRFSSLTKREREVMEHVVRGRLNKQIADTLDIGEKTVKVHRGRVMSKMAVRSVPELIRVGACMGMTPSFWWIRQPRLMDRGVGRST